MGLFSLKNDMNYYGNKNQLSAITDEDLKHLHKFLVNMLSDIIRVCEKYKITYFLGGGSCLGAVRHHGFIPWDDDLDINMPRKDYNKFQKVFEKELGDKYILNAPNYSDDVIGRFPKVLAKGTRYSTNGFGIKKEFEKIYIDIFIMENVPSNNVLRLIKGLYVNFAEFVAGQVLIYNSGKKNPEDLIALVGKKNYVIRSKIGYLFSFRSYTQWCNTVDKAVQYHGKASDLVCFPTGRKHYFGEILQRSMMLPPKKTKFETILVNIPADYKKYLSNLYGDDFMKIPPANKREKHFVSAMSLKCDED